jgi:hypothetical protein
MRISEKQTQVQAIGMIFGILHEKRVAKAKWQTIYILKRNKHYVFEPAFRPH